MCSNYRPPSRETIEEYFGASLQNDIFKQESFPGYEAPFLRLSKESGKLECLLGTFGLLPHWAKSPALARSTYNARSETAFEKPSFRNAWKKAQHCIIPATQFYEPCYTTGSPVRWKIQRRDNTPVAIAGLFEWRPDAESPDGKLSFTMLTVNGAANELMKTFHAPDDEKRMVVILDPSQYTAWLTASATESMAFMQPFPAEKLRAEPSPKPARTSAKKKAEK